MKAKPPTEKTIDQRMREARRIGRRSFLLKYANGRGSDNWYLHEKGALFDIKALWASAHRPPIPPRSFQTHNAVTGFKELGYQAVSGIDHPYGLPDDAPQEGVSTLVSDDDAIRALADPVQLPAEKHYKATGYWLFIVNPKRWDADGWRETGERELLYLVAKDDLPKMQRGDLGLLRINRQGGGPARLIAAVEVLATPTLLPEPDTRFLRDPAVGAPALRTRLAVITDTNKEVSAAAFPDEAVFRYVHAATQRATIPIERDAFLPIAKALGLTGSHLSALRSGRTMGGVRALETDALSATPTQKERISKVIERGPIGQAVKSVHNGRCQICVALGRPGAAFMKPNGDTYAEAHHVIPVSKLQTGTLSHLNIMVLCPNHHRQAHYGNFEIVSDHTDHWIVTVDQQRLHIPKTQL